MIFDYNVYLKQNCIIPLACVLFSTLCVVFEFAWLWRNHTKTSPDKVLGTILVLCIFIYLFAVNIIPLTRGGIFLLFEKERNQIQISGQIEDTINLPSFGGQKYRVDNNNGYGQAVVVNGERYYLSSYGEAKVGDEVYLKVLPRSRFVLQMICGPGDGSVSHSPDGKQGMYKEDFIF